MTEERKKLCKLTRTAMQASAKARLKLMYNVGDKGFLNHLTHINILVFMIKAIMHKIINIPGMTMYVRLMASVSAIVMLNFKSLVL